MSIKDNFPSVGPSLSLNFARSKTLDPRITFARPNTSGDATYMNGNGLIVTAAADEPRFDHKIENGVVKSLGLLVEEQRSNLVRYSEEFDNDYWELQDITGSGSKGTANSIAAPDGSNTADEINTGTSGGTADGVKNNSVTGITDNQVMTASIFVKMGTAVGSIRLRSRFIGGSNEDGNVYFDLSNGTKTSQSGNRTGTITDVGNGWYRLSITGTNNATGNTSYQLFVYGSDITIAGTYYLWGAQIEADSFPTSYIPTSSSQATRSPDEVSMTGTNFTDVYNQTEGSYKVEGFIDGTLPSNTFGGIFGAGGGSSTSNFIFLNPSNSFGQYVSNTSQTPSSTLGKTYTNGAKFKIAASYLEADFACSFNGDISNSSTLGALYGSMTYFRIGGNPISSVIKGAMRISNISYYPKQITDIQLQNLTK